MQTNKSKHAYIRAESKTYIQTHRHPDTYIHTDRQTGNNQSARQTGNKQTGRKQGKTDRQADRHNTDKTERQTDRDKQTYTDRHIYIHTNIQTDGQARQTDIRAQYRQSIQKRQTDR